MTRPRTLQELLAIGWQFLPDKGEADRGVLVAGKQWIFGGQLNGEFTAHEQAKLGAALAAMPDLVSALRFYAVGDNGGRARKALAEAGLT